MTVLSGYVYDVIYSKDGFYIMNFDVHEQEDSDFNDRAAKVKGLLPGLVQLRGGVPLRLYGRWIHSPKHGRTFKAESWDPWAKKPEDVETFLSLCVTGYTDQRVIRELTSHYGLDTYKSLTDRASEILNRTYEDISPESMQAAIDGWQRMLSTKDLSLLLTDNFTATDHQAILAKFGLDAPGIIRTNPYRLLEIRGFKFEKIDALGLSMGIPIHDLRRICGGVLWALTEASNDGHLFLRRGDLPDKLKELNIGDFPYDTCAQAVASLAATKSVIVEEGVGVYLPLLYQFERESSRLLAKMHAPSGLDLNCDEFLQKYQASSGIELSELQRKAVETLVQQRVLVLTGLPGTGKTMVIRTFVRLFEDLGMSYLLMAPTGIAAKRLSAVTSRRAGTIHRYLRYNGVDWEYGPHRLYPTKAVIVDEMSMVDMELFYRLLSALSPDTFVVLVGDSAQLPSVGPGSVIRELMSCSALPRIKLTQIFRQDASGAIVQNSHRINRGEMPLLEDPKSETEFKFVRCSDEEKIVHFIVEMAARLKAKDANFQVLSPKYEGTIGVDNLNDRLRERLNPLTTQGEWRKGKGSSIFREGDRLMVVKNDYELNIYNGDVGKLLQLLPDNGLRVRIYDTTGGEDFTVDFSEAEAGEKLRLAYAVTVHKSQGNEFDTILMPILKSQGRMLQRNLLYTAVTRARKRVWLIGEESAIFTAIRNDRVVSRNTLLSDSISAQLAV